MPKNFKLDFRIITIQQAFTGNFPHTGQWARWEKGHPDEEDIVCFIGGWVGVWRGQPEGERMDLRMA